MPPPAGNTLQPGAIGDENTESMTNATIIESYVQAVIIQPVFAKLTDVPALPKHQEESKATARQWISEVRITLYQNNQDVISFGNKFDNYYENLLKHAENIGDPESKKQFTTGVNMLLRDIQKKQASSEETAKTLAKWNERLGTDAQNFNGDLRDVEAVYEGNQGILESLKKEIAACEEAMTKDLAIIAGGAAVTIVGGLIIVVGVLAEIPSGGTSTAIVAGGILVVGGGSTMIGLASKDYQEKVEQKGRATKRLAELTAEIAVARDLSGTLGDLSTSCVAALTAANGLLSAWQVLNTKFSTLVDDVQNLTEADSDWLVEELETSKDSWDEVLKTARNIENQLVGIPVENETKTARAGEFISSYEIPAPVPVTLETLNGSVLDGVRQVLINEPLASGIVRLLQEGINALKLDIVHLKNVLKKDSVKHEASNAAKKAAALLVQLEELGTSLASQLSEVIKKAPLNVSDVQTIFGHVTAKLEAARAAVASLKGDAKGLRQQIAISVSEWSTIVKNEKHSPHQRHIAEAHLSLAKSLASSVSAFATHLRKVDAIVQVLILSFKSVATVNYDRLVGRWVHEQAKGLIHALQNLVGISAPARHGAIGHASTLLEYELPVPVSFDASLPSTLETLATISATTIDISGAAGILVRQPNIQLDDVDQFAEQFQLARDHASQFQGSYVVDLLSPISQASSLAAFITKTLSRVLVLANEGDFDLAVAGVRQIQTRIQKAIDTNKYHKLDLIVYQQAVRDDRSRFTVLEESVPSAITEEIARLTAQAIMLQAQIEEDNKKIAQGATNTVLNALLLEAGLIVAIGASFIAIPVAGEGLTLLAVKGVNAGIKGAAGAAKEEAEKQLLATIGGDDFLAQATQRIETLRTTLIQLSKLQFSLAIFNTVNAQVQQIAEDVESGVASIEAHNRALQRDNATFNVIIAELQASETTSIPKTLEEWEKINTGAPELLDSYTNFSVSTVN